VISAKVYLWGTAIGAIIQEDRGSVPTFAYDERFLMSGIEIAPLTMPLSARHFAFPALNPTTFFGLPGAFADSLPDKYGTRVFERYLTDQGRDISDISAVERLCYMGKRAMGALEYVPEKVFFDNRNEAVDIDALVRLASDVLMQRESIHMSSMEQMISIGTSAGGARAKAVIAYDPVTGDIRSGQIDAGTGYEYWIIKFDGVENNKDKGEAADGPQYTRIEYAYYLMAKNCGVEINSCRLHEENGRYHFMTKRFDRDEEGRKKHMISLEGMAHFDFNTPGVNSYEQTADILYRLNMGSDTVEQLFRRMVFNDIARNFDDHVKNTSFLMDRKGVWSLAPAYDITFAYDKSNFWLARHQMRINGKLEEIRDEDLINAGLRMNLSRQKCISNVARVKEIVSDWYQYADQAGVRKSYAEAIGKVHRVTNS